MRRSSFLAALLLLVLGAPARGATLAEAQAAYALFDVNKAETLYGAVAQSASADRAAAARELARIAWLVDDDSERAIALLEASLAQDPDPCPAALLYARVLNSGSQPVATRAKLTPWAIACRATEPRIAIEQVRSYSYQARTSDARHRQRIAARGLDLWSALPAEAQASSEGARLQLDLAVQALNPEQAMAGWRGYFWLDRSTLALPALELSDREIETAFRAGLAARPRPEDSERLAVLLMRAGFADALQDLARSRSSPALSTREGWIIVTKYLEFRAALRKTILIHDRAYARGRKDETYESRLSALLLRTAKGLDSAATDPRQALRRWFGVWGTEPGKSNGVSGIHLGHVVSDDFQDIEQDGRTGKIQLIVLDNMIHNSFSAWLMDGTSAPGGWAVNGSTMVQIRPRYLMLIDDFTKLANPGPARDEAEAELRRLASSDRQIARQQPLSFLPGVKARLRFQAIQALANEARLEGGSAQNFLRAFRKSYWNALISSSIIGHEGRHVLDQADFSSACALPNPELEYRGKLSEIRFAPNPRLAVSSIFSALFGGTSGHGIANKRLFAEYAAWIDANRKEVKDYDSSLSPLEQLDRLSDAQLAAIATSLELKLRSCPHRPDLAQRSGSCN